MTSEFARGQLRPRSLRHSDEVESVYPHLPNPKITYVFVVLHFEFCIGEELCTRRLNPKITYVFVVRTWFCSQNNRVCNPYTCESYLDDDM